MKRRTDVPESAVRSSSISAIITEWLGRLAAIIALVLFVLAMVAVHKGRVVQESARQVVQDFHTTNDLFASRADFAAADRAREHLQRLVTVLSQLNSAAERDVDDLGALIPDVARLVDAGRGDVSIAQQMQSVSATLRDSAESLRHIAGDARMSVSDVAGLLAEANRQVDLLNAQLAVTERKLALLPETGR